MHNYNESDIIHIAASTSENLLKPYSIAYTFKI